MMPINLILVPTYVYRNNLSAVQWRSQGEGQGVMAPPKLESQGAKLSFGPPHSRYIKFFFLSNIHNTLLFIVYFITREGNSDLTTSSNNKSFFF